MEGCGMNWSELTIGNKLFLIFLGLLAAWTIWTVGCAVVTEEARQAAESWGG